MVEPEQMKKYSLSCHEKDRTMAPTGDPFMDDPDYGVVLCGIDHDITVIPISRVGCVLLGWCVQDQKFITIELEAQETNA